MPDVPRRSLTVRAAPEVVWALVADATRWPEYDPFVHRVSGPPGPVAEGDRRVLVTRPVRLPVSLDVLEVLPEQLLRYRLQVAPGLSVEVLTELAPALRGGTSLTVGESREGLFERPAAPLVHAAGRLHLRRLAARAVADMRASGRAERRTGAA